MFLDINGISAARGGLSVPAQPVHRTGARANHEEAGFGVSGGQGPEIGMSCAAHQVCSQARLEEARIG
jgi:hypothetical protein